MTFSFDYLIGLTYFSSFGLNQSLFFYYYLFQEEGGVL